MIDSPFGVPVDEVPLLAAPLASVIAQVRFPAVVSIQAEAGFLAPFQEALRADYPILRQERQLQILVGPAGGVPQDAGMIWRFEQQDPDAWQVTLAPSFVSLSAKRYTNRSDLVSRLTVVLHALNNWLNPVICDRIGVRYVDRVTGEQLENLKMLVRGDVLGLAAERFHDPDAEVVHSLTDVLFRLQDASELRARWGLLPPGAVYDVGIESSPESSWVLDLDHYSAQPKDFELGAIASTMSSYCERVYRFFRWVVTDDFLDAYRAQ
jgi:uncharacterized protein (TIGR04255 family)